MMLRTYAPLAFALALGPLGVATVACQSTVSHNGGSASTSPTTGSQGGSAEAALPDSGCPVREPQVGQPCEPIPSTPIPGSPGVGIAVRCTYQHGPCDSRGYYCQAWTVSTTTSAATTTVYQWTGESWSCPPEGMCPSEVPEAGTCCSPCSARTCSVCQGGYAVSLSCADSMYIAEDAGPSAACNDF